MRQICSIHLENFKPYGNLTDIPMAPLTLIFGANSAGKSSILQAIHLLKQTQENWNTNDILTPRTENGIVDLGSFPEFVFNHDVTRKFKIRINFDISDEDGMLYNLAYLKNFDEVSRQSSIKDIAGVELHFEYSSDNQAILLSQVEISNHQVGPIARFQNSKDVRIPAELREHYNSMGGLSLPNTAFSKDQYFVQDQSSPIGYLRNTYITVADEYWKTLFESTKSKREQIVANFRSRLDLLSSLGGRSIDDKGLRTHVSGLRSVQIFRDSDAADKALAMDKYASELEIVGIKKAIDFYECDFTLSDFIKRMQAEQREETLAIFGMLELRYAGGFPGKFPEYSTFCNENISCITQRTLEICNFLKSTLDSVLPIGPHRNSPNRIYTYDGRKPFEVGFSGRFVPDLLFQSPTLVKTTNEWLGRLDIDYELKIEKTNTRYDDIYEIRFVDRTNNSIDVNLRDLGFGISQIIPVVVQCLTCRGNILTIQQPELHIHPSLQANLGDLFTESIYTKNSQLIIETHSEHLVLRLLRLVRKGKLKHDDLSILYVGRNSSGSTYVKRLRLDESGDFFDNWPGGFFPERLKEYL